jgi:hypothetical protein
MTELQNIRQSAEEHRGGLHQQLDTCRLSMEAIDADLLELDQAHTARLQEIQEIRIPLTEQEAAHAQAVAYADFAHKTHRERVAVRDVSTSREELSTLQSHIAEMEQSHLLLSNEEETRREELTKQRSALASESAAVQSQLQTVEATIGQIIAEQGEELAADRLSGYRQRARHLQQEQERWLAAQIALHDYGRESQEALSAWPGLLQAFREQLPAEDNPAIVLMQAELLFLDTLLANFDHLTRLEIRELPLVQEFGRRSALGQVKPRLFDWIVWDAALLNNPRHTKQFRDQMWQLSVEYAEYSQKRVRKSAKKRN